MSMKLMIFGGSGFVGGNLTHIALQKNWEVYIADNRPGLQAEWCEVNITAAESVEKVIDAVKPDVVVNVAAIADIDLAEREKELAYKVNVGGTRFIAKSCAKRNIRYIFFSSDAVFDGKGGPYTEKDIPQPVNYYGWTKLEGEKAVSSLYPQSVIIRISLVLGYPVTSGNSFFANLEGKLKEGKPVLAPTYEVRTPIDVLTLSECVLELGTHAYSGLIHLGATDSISRYDLTKKLTRRMGFDEKLVQPQTSDEPVPGRAARHKNGIISVALAKQNLTTRLLSTEASIERAFNDRLASIQP
jgi:dTDP-4-dehydrorhamnose reductase